MVFSEWVMSVSRIGEGIHVFDKLRPVVTLSRHELQMVSSAIFADLDNQVGAVGWLFDMF